MSDYPRVGTLCYATEQGLGYLAKDFINQGIVTDVYIMRHPKNPTHEEWYPGAPIMSAWGCDRVAAIMHWLKEKSIQVLLFFETPFDWSLINEARQLGIRTVLMPMYECTPAVPPALPDVLLCPSLLDASYFLHRHGQRWTVFWNCISKQMYSVSDRANAWTTASQEGKTDVRLVQVPVDTKAIPWQERACPSRVFVHNAGHLGLRGRNGTRELLDALATYDVPVQLILRSQEPIPGFQRHSGIITINKTTVDYRLGTAPRDTLWDEGDAFVFPEKFNGLSLPLQEAFACGMTVIATYREPMIRWLPTLPLIRPRATQTAKVGPPYLPVDEAVIDLESIASTINAWHTNDCLAHKYLHGLGKQWAEQNSWDALRPAWRSLMTSLAEPKHA